MKTNKRKPSGETGPTGAVVSPEAAGDILTMEQAIGLLRTTRPTFYRWLRSGKIKSMKAGRQWRFYREDVERFMKGEQPRIELTADIGPLLKALGERLARAGGKQPPQANGSPVARATDLMIRLGLALHASDLHVEPQRIGDRNEVQVRYRVDGVLHNVATCDVRLLSALVEHWKRMATCNVQEKGLPQDGRIMVELADGALDMRVCFLPTYLGEAFTVRFLPSKLEVALDLDRIEYSLRDRQKLVNWLGAASGMILVTGPTGCGKTTVLYACLNHVVSPRIKVLSVEDPVEFLLPGVTQVAVNAKAGLTFARALRAFLRSDPDVLMVGEIRDRETLEVCLQCALTGHLVLTTLHTQDAASTLARMTDIGAAAFMVGDATKLIVAQRLVRKLCTHCSVPAEPGAEYLDRARDLAKAGGLDLSSLPRNFRKPVGCPKCSQTGYRGRNVITEMLEVTPEIRAAMSRGASTDELRALAVQQGMTTMVADGIAKAAQGETTLAEVFGVLAVR